ncbi:hypothetical protein BP00DRAFT_359669, partial [Aspergillus indologenus CBS 114.80]
AHTTTGCGKQGFPSAQPYLSHTPGANPFCCMFLAFDRTIKGVELLWTKHQMKASPGFFFVFLAGDINAKRGERPGNSCMPTKDTQLPLDVLFPQNKRKPRDY